MTSPTPPIYLVVGVPCSGKSWVCEQLRDLYNYVRHDDYINDKPGRYVTEIIGEVRVSTRPVLCETPFSMSQIVGPLQAADFKVEPVFIIEDRDTLKRRYEARERKAIPAGHLTRQDTYAGRARDLRAYMGTSAQVLQHLRQLQPLPVPRERWPWE